MDRSIYGGSGRSAHRQHGHGRTGNVGPQAGFSARSLDVVDFVGARVSELRALRVAAASVSGNRRVYQQLSWHERRRTMSHNSHRMPARLRHAHRRELALSAPASVDNSTTDGSHPEKALGPQGKMRCRKYRRRAQFLLALRKLRAQSPLWLETHIWHAKRFHMQMIAGSRTVAMFPNDRGLRSGYRALSHASLVHDASYLDVIELTSADRASIVAVITSCLEPEDCAKITVDPVVAGTRRVERLVVHDLNGNALGPVDALWRPSNVPQLWMWSHPSASSAVAAALSAAGENGNVQVHILRDEILTMSILGPIAGSVLGAVLHRVRGAEAEWDHVKGIRSAASLPPGAVLAFEAEDPRASFPPKRTGEGGRMNGKGGLNDVLADGFATVADSGLWSPKRRKDATACAKHRDGAPFVYVPVICMQRSAGLSRGLGAGWDIVLPSGWGMPFWVSLVYANGGRAAGQRELKYFALETGIPSFPDDYQDTGPGMAAIAPSETENRAAHERRPKSKRVDFVKYRIDSPFSSNLSSLVIPTAVPRSRDDTGRSSEEGHGSESVAPPMPRNSPVRVLRSESAIRKAIYSGRYELDGERRMEGAGVLGPDPRQRKKEVRSSERRWVPVRENASVLKSVETGEEKYSFNVDKSYAGCMLQVTLRPCGKGTPLQNAVIAVPTEEDLALLKIAPREYSGPREPLARKSDLRVGTPPSRKVVGRIVNGDYSLVRGCGLGRGVMTVHAVQELVHRGARPPVRGRRGSADCTSLTGREDYVQVRVLFRNIRSLQYRFAVATVRIK